MTDSQGRIQIDDELFPDAPLSLIEAAVRHTLKAEGRVDVEVSVALLPDEEMRRLNREFLGRDHTTDVLAFSLTGGVGVPVGDVYLGHDQAERQSTEAGVALREELARLAIHGTLHVLGHDHPEGPERTGSPMFARQEELLNQLLRDVQVP